MFARASQNQAVIRSAQKWPGDGLNLNVHWLGRGAMLLLFIMMLGLLVEQLVDPSTLPIRKIRVSGALVHVNESMLNKAVMGKVSGGYFNVEVAAIREAVEQLPWVKTASVRRVWPDAIMINVMEQQPLAIWTSGGLLNTEGELFHPDTKSYPQGLLLFSAPSGMELAATELYRDIVFQLASTKLLFSHLQLDDRRAVKLHLNNGIELVLGREEQLLRLQRFMKIYEQTLAAHAARIKRIDLRYSNGMAVQWKTTTTQQQG